MTLFEEPFTDPNKLVETGSLAQEWPFGTERRLRARARQGYCIGVTRRNDFRDFSIAVDVRIVSRAVGLVLRAAAPGQYYMVQFDLANNPSVVWFHTFTPAAEGGYRLELVRSTRVPQVGAWHRMRIVVKDNLFDVFLGEPGGPLDHCASWKDQRRTFSRVRWASGSMAARPAIDPGISCGGRDWITTPNTACSRRRRDAGAPRLMPDVRSRREDASPVLFLSAEIARVRTELPSVRHVPHGRGCS